MAGDHCGPKPLQTRSVNSLTSLKRMNLPIPSPENPNKEPPLAHTTSEPSNKKSSNANTPNLDEPELRRLKEFVRGLPGTRRGKKHSYTREEKLQYIQLYKTTLVEDPKNPGVFSQMSKRVAAKKFGITHSMLINWLRKEEKIRGARCGTRWMHDGSPSWPEMEARLFDEFTENRKQGRGINKSWFIRTAKRIFRELYPEMVRQSEDGSTVYSSKFSKGWFRGFKRRWRVTWRTKTKIATKTPDIAAPLIEQWMRFNRRNSQVQNGEKPADIGRFFYCDFYNMDQTPLPYEFLDGRTYEVKGNKTVWVRTIRDGWHKRQATLMVTVCGDGKRRIDPLIIFRGERKGKGVIEEAKRYHPHVRVEFNPKAYSNEEVTLRWIYNDLKWVTDHDLDEKQPRFIALDVFRGQKTPRVLKAFKKLNFTTSFIPEGCTSYVQPLDTHLNKIFKNRISELIDIEFEKNPEKWQNSQNFCVGDRRVLVTHCVGEAWEWLHCEKQDMIRKSFRDVGLTLNVDGSEDHQLRVKDLPNLNIGDWHVGGYGCNLGRNGITCDGSDFDKLIDVDAEETEMFDYNPYDEDVHDSEEEEEEGEYVLENDFHALNTIKQWAERVKEQEADMDPSDERDTESGRALMDVSYLCT